MVLISDTDHIIAVSGGPKKDFIEKRIGKDLEKVIQEKDQQGRAGKKEPSARSLRTTLPRNLKRRSSCPSCPRATPSVPL